MTLDASSKRPPGTDAPPASLAAVPLTRRRANAASRKGGDITERLVAPAPSPPEAEPPATPAFPPPVLVASSPVPVAECSTPRPERAPRGADEIIDYWDSLRGGRAFPSLDELDHDLVADSWPNSLIVVFGAAHSAVPRISRLGEVNGEIEYTAMVTDWILSRGRHSARRGEPMEEEQRFPLSDGSARYRLLLLPFGSEGGTSDHVLCHLCRTEELSAGAAFKRWLAS